ncbi:hypothetical protein LCGC14_2591700, partial [marine sediment metagenome]
VLEGPVQALFQAVAVALTEAAEVEAEAAVGPGRA